MRVFLTGGTGFVGSRIREAMVDDGHTVVALTRRVMPPDPHVIWVNGDIADAETLTEHMRGCEVVVHLVGIIQETRKATFQSVHVDGTRHVLEAMQAAGIPRLVHMSALGAGPKGETEYFRTKWEAEELVRAAGVGFTIFRPSLIFGPGDGFISLLARQVRKWPLIPIVGTGLYPFAPISVRAVAAAYAQALRLNGAALHKTFELCGPEVLTYEQIIDLLMEHQRKRKRKVHLPVGFMRVITGAAHFARLPSPISSDQLTMLLKGSVCGEQCAREVFDLPQITLREGIAEYIHP